MVLAALLPALYFPKSVAIENRRLWIVRTISYVFIFAGVVYVLWVIPNYKMAVKPAMRKNLWIADMSAVLTEPKPFFCNNTMGYNYRPDSAHPWEFRDAQCVEVSRFNICNEGVECMPLSQVASTATGEVFIATSYVKEVYDARSPHGTRTFTSHLIPGVEKIALGIDVNFQLRVPSSWYHSALGLQMMPNPPFAETIILDQNGKQVRRWLGTKSADNSVSIETLLEMTGANLSSEVVGRVKEFPDNEDGSGEVRPKARITGLELLLSMEINNAFADSDYNGPVVKITAKATPTWVSHTVTSFTDPQGSTVTQQFQGIRVKVQEKGNLSWFQLNMVIYTLTLYSVWLQVPVFIVFYFAVHCLGTLSDVYAGFVYESVDLKREFNGVSSRMLEMSYGFHDVHDLEEDEKKVWACSRERLRKRFDVILEHDENLDAEERLKFTNYVFGKCSSPMPSGLSAIHLDDYMKPHMTGESLLFDDVLQIVDSDRSSGNILERIFMDDSLKEFSATAEKAEAAIFGKVKNTRSKHFTVSDTPETAKKQAWTHQTTKKMGRFNTIARCAYGGEVIEEQLDNLDRAFGKMYNMCDKVQSGDQGSKS